LLVIAALIAVGGFLLPSLDGPAEPTPEAVAAEDRLETFDPAALPNGVGFLDAEERTELADKAKETGRSLLDRFGPWLGRFGLSLAGGLIAGIFFRAFVKYAAMVTALLAGGVLVLSYFQIVDFSTLTANLTGAGDWAEEQAGVAKGWFIGVLPNAIGGILGFLYGFTRK
jgi:uncharacterized membrane protein (Fun14 family)